jgi:enterochelin esterase-like enzyme
MTFSVRAAGGYNSTIMRITKPLILLAFLLLIVACDPLAPQPTAQVIIITSPPSETPPPSPTAPPTAAPTDTPPPTDTPTPTPIPCDEPTGTVVNFDEFRSKVAGENLRYRVYIPPCYLGTQKRYPYVILLHASKNTETQWEKIGVTQALDQGIKIGALPPMILVMPYTGAIANDDNFPPDPSYETVVLTELMPAVERDFCTWNNRKYRAIGGISRGGFWAYSIALRHPDVFGSVGGHSAFFPDDLKEVPPAFNPLELALNSTFLSQANLRMYLDNSANDISSVNLELFSTRLSSRGIVHTYVVNPVGQHDDQYWAAHVSEYLTFYGREWPKSVADLPSCLQPSP